VSVTGLRHEQLTVAGTSFHAVTAGPADAPALVLLHGWPESWATWRELIPLAAAAHRVVAVDLPGVGGSRGGSAKTGAPGTKTAIAGLVHGLIGAMGLTDVTVVGHDIGGMVAYAYLRGFPELPRAVIMDVPIPGVDPWEEFVRAHGTPDTLAAGLGWYRAFADDTRDNQAAASGPPVSTPLLYLRGSAERGGPIGAYADGLRRAGVTDVRPAVIEGAGHFPHEEAAPATWRAISGFIADTG
jgi:pimeloyl-ACP methyl ester carboxylesterase